MCTPSLQLKNLLKILNAMFAQGAFKIGREGVTLIYIAANLANPTAFAVFGLFSWLRFGLDVLLVVVVGRRGFVGQHLGIENIGNEHGVRAEIDAFGDTAGQVGVGVFRNIEHMVDGSVFSLTVSEFVHLAPRLESWSARGRLWRRKRPVWTGATKRSRT